MVIRLKTSGSCQKKSCPFFFFQIKKVGEVCWWFYDFPRVGRRRRRRGGGGGRRRRGDIVSKKEVSSGIRDKNKTKNFFTKPKTIHRGMVVYVCVGFEIISFFIIRKNNIIKNSIWNLKMSTEEGTELLKEGGDGERDRKIILFH